MVQTLNPDWVHAKNQNSIRNLDLDLGSVCNSLSIRLGWYSGFNKHKREQSEKYFFIEIMQSPSDKYVSRYLVILLLENNKLHVVFS